MSGPAVIGPGRSEPRPRPLLRATLGDVLRRTRLQQRRTLADVARAARVSMPYLSELERGRKEASSEVLAALCDALRIELSDLLAAVGRDLAGRRGRRGQVVHLAAIRGERIAAAATAAPEPAAAPEGAAPEGAAPSEAAAAPEAGAPEAGAVPEAAASPEARVHSRASRTARAQTSLVEVTGPAGVTGPAEVTEPAGSRSGRRPHGRRTSSRRRTHRFRSAARRGDPFRARLCACWPHDRQAWTSSAGTALRVVMTSSARP